MGEGGPAYDVSYLWFDGGLDAALDSMGAIAQQLRPVEVPGADAARVAVKPRTSGIPRHRLRPDRRPRAERERRPARPYDEQRLVSSTTALLGALAAAAPPEGVAPADPLRPQRPGGGAGSYAADEGASNRGVAPQRAPARRTLSATRRGSDEEATQGRRPPPPRTDRLLAAGTPAAARPTKSVKPGVAPQRTSTRRTPSATRRGSDEEATQGRRPRHPAPGTIATTARMRR